MNQFIARLAVVLATTAFAGAPAFAANTQQNRMKKCNAQAKEQALEGQARKDFMKECLSAAKAEGKKKLTEQQQKMKACNAEAKTQDLKGGDRKKFMSECLSR